MAADEQDEELREKIDNYAFRAMQAGLSNRNFDIAGKGLDKIMDSIAHYTQEAVEAARIDEVKRFGTEWGNNPNTPHWYAWDDYIEDRLAELSAPQQPKPTYNVAGNSEMLGEV